MDIFKALIENHEVQRKLCGELSAAKQWETKKKKYEALRLELMAHAVAEERHLYLPLMQYDDGMEIARHAIAEHHEMDELIATLSDGRTGENRWLETAEELIETVEHHLKEEEDEIFADARKVLDKAQIDRLGPLYQTEYEEFKAAESQ
ncbi:hemerythrin domain-containing protein [Neisseria weixii]|uniref:Hemerythrin domain-containing protein n=1 Tax=Neisseria weixii TaxID=1853276 RepID=A0A3N4MR47_9NEIS|nr:hemerythrin domain-containing protein [Neisseria weixii]RPD84237.1 hemerythrin domain-containing protein [Neisseria weixii]RPD84865.1 hemerythrin domain-containing protein [Neisseria weixii]